MKNISISDNKINIEFSDSDFCKYNQVSYTKNGFIIPNIPNPKDENNRYYNLIINGKEYEALALSDHSIDHIPARLQDGRVDMRQARVFVLDGKGETKTANWINITYYLKRDGSLELIVLFLDKDLH